MSMRITQSMLAAVPRRDLQAALRRLNDAQEALTSGQRITRPSQDPVAAGRASRAARALAESEERGHTLDTASRMVSQAASLAEDAAQLLRSARDVALQAASATTVDEMREPMAQELDSIMARLVDIGNARCDGRFLFAGGETLTRPFDYTPGSVPTYNGDAGERIVMVSPGTRMAVSIPGSVLFNAGGAGDASKPDILATLASLRDQILAGSPGAIPEERISELNDAEAYMLEVAADLGGRQQRIRGAQSMNADAQLNLNAILSEEAGTDISQAVIELNAQAVAYEAALTAAGRVVSAPSVLDFLR